MREDGGGLFDKAINYTKDILEKVSPTSVVIGKTFEMIGEKSKDITNKGITGIGEGKGEKEVKKSSDTRKAIVKSPIDVEERHKRLMENLKNFTAKEETPEEVKQGMEKGKKDIIDTIKEVAKILADTESNQDSRLKDLKDKLSKKYPEYKRKIDDEIKKIEDNRSKYKNSEEFWSSLKEEKGIVEFFDLEKNFCKYYNLSRIRDILRDSGFSHNDRDRRHIMGYFRTDREIEVKPIAQNVLLKKIHNICFSTQSEDITEETSVLRDRMGDSVDTMEGATKDAASLVPEVLQNFEGNYEKWNKQKYSHQSLKDTTGLGRYQEFLKENIKNTEVDKQAAYKRYDNKIKNEEFYLVDAMTYATMIGVNIADYGEFKCFIGAVCNREPDVAKRNPETYGVSYKYYKEKYDEYYNRMIVVEEEIINQTYVEPLTARYEAAAAVAETRSIYGHSTINLNPDTDEHNQSGLRVASTIDTDKIHTQIKFDKSDHEEAAIRYAAVDITFKNTFKLNELLVQKLAALNVDLRADLFNYHIYNKDTLEFNESARGNYIKDKLKPMGLSDNEIVALGKLKDDFKTKVNENYKNLSTGFETDQNSFEKIAKICALGEIIDNIKFLFSNGDILSENKKLGSFNGLVLDENEPADIVGDFLLLNGTINGTKTKIKYDLRTGKLYMNALVQQEFNPPKIKIGNEEPTTPIGDIGNFEDILNDYQPSFFLTSDNENENQPSNSPNNNESNNNSAEPDNQSSEQKSLESLVKNKLLEKLEIMGTTLQEKIGEQSSENVVIDKLLKTFNIIPNEGNKSVEFIGGSNLFFVLNCIKHTNSERILSDFSNLMNNLMSCLNLARGKNTVIEPDITSISIFNMENDINGEVLDKKNNKTKDINNLKDAFKDLFSGRIKNSAHFDSNFEFPFADIIADKCCKDGKINTEATENFVTSINVIAIENSIENAYT